MNKRPPNPIDIHVGAQVRRARNLLGMSQTTLADALKLTFQQVQKYEKGTNRIGAGRLQQISLTVRQPIPWFYEGAPGANASPKSFALAAPADPCQQLGTTREGLALARAFLAIDDSTMRGTIVAMAQAAAKLCGEQNGGIGAAKAAQLSRGHSKEIAANGR
jgi:transcriptional regulator with XRE-family HTH domain